MLRGLIRFSFYVLLLVAIINVSLQYFYAINISFGSLAQTSALSQFKFAITIIALLFVGFTASVAYKTKVPRVRKNALRLSLITMLIVLISSLVNRFTEVYIDYLANWRWSQTILYALIFICLLALARILFNKLVRISDSQ